jgi:hypothetical protein
MIALLLDVHARPPWQVWVRTDWIADKFEAADGADAVLQLLRTPPASVHAGKEAYAEARLLCSHERRTYGSIVSFLFNCVRRHNLR